MGIIYETAADTYAPTPLSNFLIDPKAYGAFSTVYVPILPGISM